MIRALAMLLWAESLRTLRAREVYSYLLLPALLAVPVLLAGFALVRSFTEAPTVALPADLPPGFEEIELAEALDARRLRAVYADDPAAELQAGRVDAAVVQIVAGDGVGEAAGDDRPSRPDPPSAGIVRWRWRLGVAGDPEIANSVRAAARDAGDVALSRWVSLAGGDPARDLWIADIELIPVEGAARDARLTRIVVAYLVFAVGLFGVMMIVGTVTAERSEGVMESVAAAASPPALWLLARLVAVTLLQCFAVAALFVSVSLVLRGIGASLPWPAWALLRMLAALSALNSLFLVVAVLSPDARIGIGAGSYALLGAGALLGWGAFDAPIWVPLAGMIRAGSALEIVPALLSTAAAAALLFVAAAQIQAWKLRQGRA